MLEKDLKLEIERILCHVSNESRKILRGSKNKQELYRGLLELNEWADNKLGVIYNQEIKPL
jgi:hypothetical protein